MHSVCSKYKKLTTLRLLLTIIAKGAHFLFPTFDRDRNYFLQSQNISIPPPFFGHNCCQILMGRVLFVWLEGMGNFGEQINKMPDKDSAIGKHIYLWGKKIPCIGEKKRKIDSISCPPPPPPKKKKRNNGPFLIKLFMNTLI